MTQSQPYRARKRFGQNFLVDQNIITKIVKAINPESGEAIVEIGPGLGALTTHLLPLVNQLQVIELDRDIIPRLEQACAGLGNLIIHQADVLKFDFNQLKPSSGKLRVVGNLPYNISTPLLFHLTQYGGMIDSMVFMLQKEVVNRICAMAGDPAYGRLTVMTQYYYQTEALFNVPSTAFRPQPQVDSSVIRLIPHREKPYQAQSPQHLKQLVTLAFNARRKTIANALKSQVDKSMLIKASIDPGKRPQEISLEQYVALSNQVMSPN